MITVKNFLRYTQSLDDADEKNGNPRGAYRMERLQRALDGRLRAEHRTWFEAMLKGAAPENSEDAATTELLTKHLQDQDPVEVLPHWD